MTSLRANRKRHCTLGALANKILNHFACKTVLLPVARECAVMGRDEEGADERLETARWEDGEIDGNPMAHLGKMY